MNFKSKTFNIILVFLLPLFFYAQTSWHVTEMEYCKYDLEMKKSLKILTNKKLVILIVQNKKKQTTGIITDGQIRRFNQKNPNLLTTKVSKVMTKNPISVEKNDLAARALSIMNSRKITSLCVFDKKNKSKTIGVLHVHTILQSNIS